MKKIVKKLIAPFVALVYYNLALSQVMPKESELSLNIISDDFFWTESSKNVEYRKHGDIGFFYPYDLPDAHGEALALFRAYNTPINSGLSIIAIDNPNKSLKAIKDRAKFSGSDIDQTKDTLIIAAHYVKSTDSLLIANLNKGLIPDRAALLKLSEPLAQFGSFYLNLAAPINIAKEKYMVIQLIIKSGSDDNYYYGKSNAVIDHLHFSSVTNN